MNILCAIVAVEIAIIPVLMGGLIWLVLKKDIDN